VSNPNHPIPEFHVQQRVDGRWEAVARYEITPLLASYGARGVISADTRGDLELLCTAERVRIDLLRQAQQAISGDELSTPTTPGRDIADVVRLGPNHQPAS
jgi:hypothetical protein